MPDAKISALTAQTTGSVAPGDLFVQVDVSDGTMAATGTDKKVTAGQYGAQGSSPSGLKQYVDCVNGSDSNDGLSWYAPKLTVANALANVVSMSGSNYRGDVYLSAGRHPVSSQLVVPGSVSLHGNERASGGGFELLYDNGSWLEWTGTNPAAGASTGSVLAAGLPSFTDYARGGVIENLGINIPTSMPNLRAFDLVNWQNMSAVKDILINGPAYSMGFCAYNTLSLGAPGFFSMERCWVAGGATRPFLFSGGVEQIMMIECGIDDASTAAAGVTVGASGVTGDVFPGGASLTLLLVNCKNEMAGTSTGDYPWVQVAAGSYDCDLTMIGCYEQSNFTTAGGLTTPTVSYLATPSQADDGVGGVPVHIVGMSSQSRSILLSAPNVTPAIVVRPETTPAAGQRTRWSWDRSNRAGVSLLSTSSSVTATRAVTLVNASGGARTITLPTAVGKPGVQFLVKKVDSSGNAVTIATTSGQTIDGSATKSLGVQYAFDAYMSDGSNWMVVL